MATLKQWLNEAGFDWKNGTIVYQEVLPYDSENSGGKPSPGWGKGGPARYITSDDPILVQHFDSGFGGPEAPRIFARDDKAIYFPRQYDGSTWLEKIYTNSEYYLTNDTPYLGG